MDVEEQAPRIDPVGRRRGSGVTGGLFSVPVAGLAVWALVLFLTDHPAKSPVYAAVPRHPARVSVGHGQCHGTDGLGDQISGRDRVWVDAAPSAALALWLPGMNDRPCVSALTRLDARHAQALAAAVRSAKPFTSGASACPGADGAAVTIFFTYPGTVKAEVVRLSLSGCGGVTAPGRDSRILPESGYAALRPAPVPWIRYTRG